MRDYLRQNGRSERLAIRADVLLHQGDLAARRGHRGVVVKRGRAGRDLGKVVVVKAGLVVEVEDVRRRPRPLFRRRGTFLE